MSEARAEDRARPKPPPMKPSNQASEATAPSRNHTYSDGGYGAKPASGYGGNGGGVGICHGRTGVAVGVAGRTVGVAVGAGGASVGGTPGAAGEAVTVGAGVSPGGSAGESLETGTAGMNGSTLPPLPSNVRAGRGSARIWSMVSRCCVGEAVGVTVPVAPLGFAVFPECASSGVVSSVASAAGDGMACGRAPACPWYTSAPAPSTQPTSTIVPLFNGSPSLEFGNARNR